MSEQPGQPVLEPAETLERELERACQRLEQARAFAKPRLVAPALAQARKLMLAPDGIVRLARWAVRLDRAGLFAGTDWDSPQSLQANLVPYTLASGDAQAITLECLSQLRLLAIAKGGVGHRGVAPEQAHHFLTQVLALNLDRLFEGKTSEITRQRPQLHAAVDHLFQYLLEHIGYQDILGSLVGEIWRILGQRPIQVNHVKAMITQIAVTLASGNAPLGDARLGADRLISALFGPTQQSMDDPGLEVYRERLTAMDQASLQQEANGFARAMHDVGLVSDYHADFLRWLLENDNTDLIPDTLGLSTTGLDCLRCYSELVHRLIDETIYPQTAQTLYGLAMLLERGLLYMPPIAPALWRQIKLPLSAESDAALAAAFNNGLPRRVVLLAGVISVLGQPLGVAQGNNPTCQSVRAISMWALTDPSYLLHLIAQAARFGSVMMHFEGTPLVSKQLPAGLVRTALLDNDPVSTLLVPHLDRIYQEMGRLCHGRDEDPHRWINPEFHGWWVRRDFAIAVDIHTGKLKDYDTFVRHFLASYHPMHNDNGLMIHPQPAGLAVTDSNGVFIGWHAITLLRVALDQAGVTRGYFYNPNNDSGQDWGFGVEVSTQSNGERYGEASLPFNQLASRIYIFHDDPLSEPPISGIPADEVDDIIAMAIQSWAADRQVDG